MSGDRDGTTGGRTAQWTRRRGGAAGPGGGGRETQTLWRVVSGVSGLVKGGWVVRPAFTRSRRVRQAILSCSAACSAATLAMPALSTAASPLVGRVLAEAEQAEEGWEGCVRPAPSPCASTSGKDALPWCRCCSCCSCRSMSSSCEHERHCPQTVCGCASLADATAVRRCSGAAAEGSGGGAAHLRSDEPADHLVAPACVSIAQVPPALRLAPPRRNLELHQCTVEPRRQLCHLPQLARHESTHGPSPLRSCLSLPARLSLFRALGCIWVGQRRAWVRVCAVLACVWWASPPRGPRRHEAPIG